MGLLNNDAELHKNISRILSDDKYLDWLCEFTERYPKFILGDERFMRTGISKKDFANLQDFYWVYQATAAYAEKHNIKHRNEGNKSFLIMEYNGICFYVGLCYIDCTSNFFCRVNNKFDDAIPFSTLRKI